MHLVWRCSSHEQLTSRLADLLITRGRPEEAQDLYLRIRDGDEN
jgi:hypothetical protein